MYSCIACLGCIDCSGMHWLFRDALIVPGCVHVCLRFAVDVGSSGVCMFHVLILVLILFLNCEVLWATLVGVLITMCVFVSVCVCVWGVCDMCPWVCGCHIVSEWCTLFIKNVQNEIIIIRNSYIAPNPTWLAHSTSQFKTRMDIRINTWNMHTPDDPTSTAKRRQTCTHPGTISATQTCNAAIHGPWKHLMIGNQIQRASKTGFYWKVWENKWVFNCDLN